jgi:hypothetical protein
MEVGRERDENWNDDARRHGVAREEQVQTGDGEDDDERAQRIGHRRDLTEEHPGEPAGGAAVEHSEAEREARDDRHQPTPFDLRLGFLPRQHADTRQEERDTAREPDRFDRQRDASAAPAASRARRRLWIPTTRGPAAGRAKSWNAGFISRRNKGPWSKSQDPNPNFRPERMKCVKTPSSTLV